MKKGFQIEIQEDLTEHEKELAILFSDGFLKRYLEDGKTWYTKGGYKPYLRRRMFGWDLSPSSIFKGVPEDKKYSHLLTKGSYGLVFRRASKARRIFQIVRNNLITLRNGEKVIKNAGDSMCMCRHHGGLEKVSTKYGDIKTKVYLTIGDLKGQ